MGGNRYYCELCDKAFADNISNRRNHLRGYQHLRKKKAHYDTFRDLILLADAATLYSEEMSRAACRIFRTKGQCPYGDDCRYSHLSREQLDDLECTILNQKEDERRRMRQKLLSEPVPKLQDWLAKHINTDESDKEAGTFKFIPEKITLPEYSLPLSLTGFRKLPPSVLPPSPNCLDGLSAEDWG